MNHDDDKAFVNRMNEETLEGCMRLAESQIERLYAMAGQPIEQMTAEFPTAVYGALSQMYSALRIMAKRGIV